MSILNFKIKQKHLDFSLFSHDKKLKYAFYTIFLELKAYTVYI